MSKLTRTLIVALLASTSGLLSAQLQSAQQCEQTASVTAPCVYQVDPPDWWTNMPAPLLLLYGRNLKSSLITVRGGASIARTTFSDNGHYAFVWLKEEGAESRILDIRVTTPAGNVHFPYKLNARNTANGGFAGFSSADVMYLIMTDRFADGDISNDPSPSERNRPRGWHGGDFRGIEQHLDYLQQLGVTTVWTTPAYSNAGASQAYHGYSATDMYAVDPHFGTVADYQHLARALHDRGMKIVLDTVPNHVGAAHPWANDPPTPDWFHGTVEHHDTAKTEFRSLPDPHASWQEQHDVTEGWFANVLPDLNQENPVVSQYLIQNAIWWTETAGLDGLRIDTFPYVSRRFWHDFHAELHALYPHLTTVGEVFNSDPTITSFFAGGAAHDGIDTGLDTPFDFPIYFALRRSLTAGRVSSNGQPGSHQPMTAFEDVLRQDHLYPHPERLVTFLGNHDTPRFLNEPGATIADLKIAFGLLATLRGMPQIYSGDEIVMRGGEDPDNRHDFPGGFPGDASSAFTAAGRTPEQKEVFDWVSGLMQFRKSKPALLDGWQQDIFSDDTAFVFVRANDTNSGCSDASAPRMLIAVNDSDQPRELKIPTAMTALEGCTRIHPELGAPASASAVASEIILSLSAKQLAIYQVR